MPKPEPQPPYEADPLPELPASVGQLLSLCLHSIFNKSLGYRSEKSIARTSNEMRVQAKLCQCVHRPTRFFHLFLDCRSFVSLRQTSVQNFPNSPSL